MRIKANGEGCLELFRKADGDKRKAETIAKVVEEGAPLLRLLQQLCGSVPLGTWGNDGDLLARPVTCP